MFHSKNIDSSITTGQFTFLLKCEKRRWLTRFIWPNSLPTIEFTSTDPNRVAKLFLGHMLFKQMAFIWNCRLIKVKRRKSLEVGTYGLFACLV